MTLWTSVKYLNVVGKKMARNGRKMAIYESKIFIFFLTKLKKKPVMENCVFHVLAFDPIVI